MAFLKSNILKMVRLTDIKVIASRSHQLILNKYLRDGACYGQSY